MRPVWETIATTLNDIVQNKATQITQKPHKGIDQWATTTHSIECVRTDIGPWSVWRMTPSLQVAIISSFVLANNLNKIGGIEPTRRRKLSDRRHYVACMFTVSFYFPFFYSLNAQLRTRLRKQKNGRNGEKEEWFEVSTGVRANTRSYNNQVSISNSRTCLLHLEP